MTAISHLLKRSFTTTSSKAMKITPIQARTDNWMYILQDDATNEGAVIDPYDHKKIQHDVKKAKVDVTHLLTTHHHDDHSGGNKGFLVHNGGTEVFGGSDKVPDLSHKVSDGEVFHIGQSLEVKCIATPCHTQDSICYFVTDTKTQEKAVFTGDTLFTAGCGRFFEGTPAEMHSSLQKLMALPDDTVVYNGHEYTAGSAKFGASIEPSNKDLKTLAEAAAKGPVINNKYTIGDEKKWNVFVRLGVEEVKAATKTEDPVEAIGKLREMKNNA